MAGIMSVVSHGPTLRSLNSVCRIIWKVDEVMEDLDEEEFLADLYKQGKSNLLSKKYLNDMDDLNDMDNFLEKINEDVAKWSDGLVFNLQKTMKEEVKELLSEITSHTVNDIIKNS